MSQSSVMAAFPGWRLMLAVGLACGLSACGGGGYGGGGGGGGGSACGMYSSCTPTVSISAPAASASVSGAVMLTANAGAVGTYTVANVQFKVDGTAVGTAVTAAPYSYSWDSTGATDGAHQISAVVTDSAGQTATSTAVSVMVANTGAFALSLVPGELFPVPASSASGSGTLTFNKTSGQGSGSVTLSGVTASAVEIGDAYAGSSSAAIYTLTQNASNANQWDVSGTTILTTQQRADLLAGKLYVLVRSAAVPTGELRAQLVPPGILVKFAQLIGAAEVPAVSSAGSGMAALTVDSTALKAAVHVAVAGITPSGAELDTGAAGTVGTMLASLAVDALDSHHYLNEAVTLAAADLTNISAGAWSANVFTAAHPGGELRGPAATLTQLQTDIFTPRCSGCHDGVGSGLPHSQNLSAGNTYANVVGVASQEQGTLMRIKPGDPDNSYLVRKVQGTAGITGVQMPASGALLTQAQIDSIRAWVSAGAQNN
jgi:hypothetical protein